MKTIAKKSPPRRPQLGKRRQEEGHCIAIDLSAPRFREADELIRKMYPGDSLEKRIRSSAEQLVAALLVGYGGYFYTSTNPPQVVPAAEFLALESWEGGAE